MSLSCPEQVRRGVIMKKFLVAMLVFLSVLPFAAAYGVTFYNPAWNPQYGKVFEFVEAGKPYPLDVRNPDIAITKIIFTIEREVKNGGLTIYHLKSIPSSLPEVAENESYEFNEIKYSGFVPHDTRRFVYEFKVEKGWLTNMSVARDTVALHLYDNTLEVWDTLPTQITGENESHVFYRAEGAGVHYLFIGKAQSGAVAEASPAAEDEGESIEVKAEQPTPEGVVELPSEVTPVQLGQQQPAQQPASLPSLSPAPVPEPVPEPGSSKLIGALVLIAIAVIVLIVYLVFGRKKLGYSVDKELSSYISESIRRGKTKEEVRNRLLEVGWHHERVDKALARFKESKPAQQAVSQTASHPASEPAKSMSLAEAKALAEKQRAEMKNAEARRKPAPKSKKK